MPATPLPDMIEPSSMPVRVAALYCFAPFEAPEVMRDVLADHAQRLGLRGTLLVAVEGINGTIAGPAGPLEEMIVIIRALPGCADADVKWSDAPDWPFGKMKVKVKQEIVTLRAGPLDPARNAGHHVPPADWNALIADPDTIVIDTRNDYEVAIGTFERAIDPHTRTFAEFPAWFDAQAAQWAEEGRSPRIAMFCTGGIRCEKSTAFVRSRGFEDVYHLKGGILAYLEQVPASESLWRGDCFVFDERVAISHGLEIGTHSRCDACGGAFANDGLAAHQAECPRMQERESSGR